MNCITHICVKSSDIKMKGDIIGDCVVCGNSTNEGISIKKSFSGKFTRNYNLCYGDCVCPFCFEFLKNSDFRKKSWVATKDKVIFGKRAEIRTYIFNPPKKEFVIYITKTGKRQGWLDGIHYINYTSERFYILTDFAGAIYANRDEAIEMYEVVKLLRSHKISKTQIITGEFKVYTYKKAIQDGYEDLLKKVKKYIGNPLWEVIVYVAD